MQNLNKYYFIESSIVYLLNGDLMEIQQQPTKITF